MKTSRGGGCSLAERGSLVMAVAAFLLSTVAAGEGKSGTRPNVISVPSGPGTISGLGEQFQPNLNTGSGSYLVPLSVPQGTAGLQPKLALRYDTGGGNGPLGLGWTLGLASIRRQTDKGIPRYGLDDRFLFNGQELVPVGAGTYRLEVEGSFMRFRRGPSHWEADAPDGTLYRFGVSDGARQTDPSVPASFSWALEQVIDVFGNRIHYSYVNDRGVLYPARIEYNAREGASHSAVVFEYEDRPDVFSDCRAGYCVRSAKRLSAVRMESVGALVRRYELTYLADSRVSLLETVTLVGSDGVSRLPPMRLTYSRFSPDRTQLRSLENPPAFSLFNANVELTDFDGDSLPDLLLGELGSHQVSYNRSGRWSPAQAITAAPSVQLSGVGVQLADLDGNGIADLVAKLAPGTGDFHYFPNEGSGRWGSGRTFLNNPPFSFEDSTVRLVDLDGDGLTDSLQTTPSAFYYWRNRGDGTWESPVTLTPISEEPVLFSNPQVRLADINGDRLIDLCRVDAAGVRYWPGLGHGRWGPMLQLGGVPAVANPQDLQLADLDGDGLADLSLIEGSTIRMWLQRGADHFDAEWVVSGLPESNPVTTRVRLADMDGSGTVDILWNAPAATSPWVYLDLNGGVRANLLERVENGLGRTVSLEYASSGELFQRARELGQPWASRLPFPVQVVTALEVSDGRGWVSRQELDYGDGYFDGATRQFRGFSKASRTEVGDERQPTAIYRVTFDLGQTEEVLKGSLLTSEVTDSQGLLLRREVTSYEVRSHAEGLDGRSSRSVERTALETQLHEKADRPATLREEWAYDDYGGVIAHHSWGVTQDGDPRAGEDERHTFIEYAQDLQRWLLQRPARTWVTDSKGNRLAESHTFYDGSEFAGLSLGQLGSRGSVSRVAKWVGGDRYVDTERVARDAYGNVVAMLDPRGTRREVTYDAQTHRVATRERVEREAGEWLELQADYDPIALTLLSFRDFAGRETRFRFDAFQRPIAVLRPLDPEDDPTLRFVYEPGNPLSRIITLSQPSPGKVLEQHQWQDGLGRRVGTISSAEGGRTLASGLLVHGSRGSVTRAFDPFFSEGFELPSPTGNTFVEHSHDELGRPIGLLFQDGSRREHRYRPLEVEHWTAEDLNEDSLHRATPRIERSNGLGLVEILESLNGLIVTTQVERDGLGRILARVDAEGHRSEFQYDGLGRVISSTLPARGVDHFEYDDSGNLTARIDARGARVESTFDALDRVILVRAVTSDGAIEDELRYHFDVASPLFPKSRSSLGSLGWVEDATGEHHFNYDSRGRIGTSVRKLEGQEFRFEETHDRLDRIVHTRYPDGRDIHFEFNDRGLLASIPGHIDTIEYDARGMTTRLAYANGVEATAEFDSVGRQKVSRTALGDYELQSLEFHHNQDGALTRVADVLMPSGALSSAQDYEYDSLYRLVGVQSPTATWSYSYDKVGNLLSKSDLGAYVYESPHLATRIGGDDYSYDLTGNMVRRPGSTQGFDAQGRLVSVVQDDGTKLRWRHGYPGTVASLEQSGPSGVHTTLYVDERFEIRDGEAVSYLFAGKRRLVELRGAPAASAIQAGLGGTRSLLGGLASLLMLGALGLTFRKQTRALARRSFALGTALGLVLATSCQSSAALEGNRRFFHHDLLGSVAFVTDAVGAASDFTRHDPYGQATHGSVGPWGFAGQESVVAAGLSLFAARAYDPRIGRFLSPDPAASDPEFGLDDTQLLSLFSYARSTPSFFVDWLGLKGKDIGLEMQMRAKAAYDAMPVQHRIAQDANQRLLVREANWQQSYQSAPWQEQVVYDVSEVSGGNDMARGYTGENEVGDQLSVWERIKTSVKGVLTAAGWAQTGVAVWRFGASKSLTSCVSGSCGGPGICFVEGTEVATEDGLVPIEGLRLGDRVEAGNPRCSEERLGPDVVSIHLAIPNPDQPLDIFHVWVAKPLSWLTERGFLEGKTWLDLPELGASGWATIVEIGPRPVEQPGSGCLVLMTAEHLADRVLRLHLRGLPEPLEVTPTHPLYLEGAGWTEAGQLLEGDLLRGDQGGLVVERIEQGQPHQKVYNIEVGLEHSYRVTGLSVWAHNTCGTAASKAAGGGGGGATRSFFEGTRYTPKVLQQMRGGPGEFHSFPESVTAFESAGTVRSVVGGDGVVRQMLEIPGSYSTSRGVVRDGVFQFMKEADGAINHRLFLPRNP